MVNLSERQEGPKSPEISIAIMQGRLVPPSPGLFQCFPRKHWQEEIRHATQVPLQGIEWIYDLHGEGANPLESDSGLEHLRALANESRISIRSLCADYFMDQPILRIAEQDRTVLFQRFCWLIERCGRLGIQHMVVPFVDTSKIETAAEEDTVIAFVNKALPFAEKHQVEIHLETSLQPQRFGALLARLDHPMVKANYDLGNSASLGYHPHDEFKAYGTRVGSVHIKDRLRGGGTVPLGQGAVDFSAVKTGLKSVGYNRFFVLQVARDEAGREIDWARNNAQFVNAWWHSSGVSS